MRDAGRAVVLIAVLAVAAASLTGCTPGPVASPDWRPVALPAPTAAGERLALRDAVRCGDAWLVTGALVEADRDSRPAGWSSADGATWTALDFEPSASYYAQRAVILSAGCDDGRPAFVGAKAGGGHGNPRVSTWYERADGAFTDVVASFELYGGEKAVSVGRITAGPDGWLISGNRTNGAAVWRSPDAHDFTLEDGLPGLSSDDAAATFAKDAVYADGWVIVGRAGVHGRAAPVPMAWTSADGRTWARETPPSAGDGYQELDRVAAFGDGVLAAGVAGGTLGAWLRGASGWSEPARFGTVVNVASAFVTGLAVVGGVAFVTGSDGAQYHLWASRDGSHWDELPLPVAVAAGGDASVTIAGAGSELVLIEDDGHSGRAFLADVPS